MDYEAAARADLISRAGWRLLLAATLAALLVHVVLPTGHLTSAALIAAAVALLLFDTWNLARRDRIGGAPAAASAEARERAERLERTLALLDAVTVALFSLSPDGRIGFANRAARTLCGGDAGRLEDVACLGPKAAAAILALPVGGRQLLVLPDGRAMLVWVGSYSTPEAGAHRLVSLQAVAGELDAVQVAAWHDMTRVLAHEMMNALTPIASLSESLLRLIPGTDAAVAGAVDTIARQSRNLMSFVERYRTVVDLPAPELGRIGLAAFVADLDALAGAELRGRGIAFAVQAPPQGATVRGDPALLAQALLNLLRNAADAVAGSPAPEVRLSCVRGGGSVRFEVSDNGCGVDRERLEEIFVPFFTTKEGGAGIGLTLARQVALAHGGRLTATRNAGAGMTFALSLPG